MVTDALKKVREYLAYGLLAVAALYLISGLSLLFKSQDDIGLDFSGKSAVFGHIFAHPVLILCVVGAIALVVSFGQATKNARIVVLVGLAILAIALLLALIAFFASFGADDNGLNSAPFGGLLGAGKIVGTLLTLAQLVLLGLAAWYAYTVFKSLPKTAASTASSWGQGQAYAGAQGYGQPTWGQPDAGYGQQAWGQPPGSPGWPGAQASPAAGATAVGSAAGGWGESPGQPVHQGQPASAWGTAEPTYAPQVEGQPDWGAGAQQQWQQTSGGQWPPPEGGHVAQSWGSGGAPPPPERQSGGAPPPPERQGSTAINAGETQQPNSERLRGEHEGPDSPEGRQPPEQEQSGWWRGPAQ